MIKLYPKTVSTLFIISFFLTSFSLLSQDRFILRINAGGSEINYNRETYSGDTYFDTGLTLDRPQTGLPEPFQTFRFSRSQQLSYDIPVPDGEYTVNLYFAELWFGASGGGAGGPGKRVFDVNVEGQLVEDNLDIFAQVGAETTLIRTHLVTITDGVLNIDFDSRDEVGGERHPVINAIEILGNSIDDTTAPIVTNISTKDITTSSFTVDWSLDEGSTGRIEWGTSNSLGNQTLNESNFLTQHIQTVSGLDPGSTYYYRVIGEDRAGNSFVGDFLMVTTLGDDSIFQGFVVVNADTGEDLFFLTEEVIDLAELPTSNIDIRVETSQDVTSLSVGFHEDKSGGQGITLDYNAKPFLITSENNLLSFKSNHEYALFVSAGDANFEEISFKIIDSDEELAVTDFVFADSYGIGNHFGYVVREVGYLRDGYSCPNVDGGGDFDHISDMLIRVNTSSTVASVSVELFDYPSFSKQIIENGPSYLDQNAFNDLPPGDYIIRATPFSGLNATGNSGEPYDVSFIISDSCEGIFAEIEKTDVGCNGQGGRAIFVSENANPSNIVGPEGTLYSWNRNEDGNLEIENIPPGNYTVTYYGGDLCSDSLDFVIGLNCEEPNDFTLRLNTGGTETDYNGETFVTDTYFNTGNTLDRPQTGLPEPYQTFRFSRSQKMSYDIPVPDGEYTVNLHFAELWFGATGGGAGGVGSRVFDVNIEGELAEDNLDIFAEVGADAMLMKSHIVTVTGGVLNIDFDSRDEIGGERHPVINAIEILGEASEPSQRPFVTTWKTDNEGKSADNQITIETHPDELYNYSVAWGDGTSDTGVTGDIVHTYEEAGTYQVSISGQFPRTFFAGLGDRPFISDLRKIVSVDQWGDIEWSSMESAFQDCYNLDVKAQDIPDLSAVTSIKSMFSFCRSLVGSESFNSWDLTNVTDTSLMFSNADNFNQPIGNWNVANVTNFEGMFTGADLFNQPIGNWNVANSTNMRTMFALADSFNQPIGNWNVSNVTNMGSMFIDAFVFDQDIGNWDVSAVTDMRAMFSYAYKFNQDISNWNVSNVIYMNSMFDTALSFNQPVGKWNVANVTNMADMFKVAKSFNQTLEDWNVSKVTEMGQIFQFKRLAGERPVELNYPGTGMSEENYASTLIGWSQLTNLQRDVNIYSSIIYCQATEARQKLMDDYNWNIYYTYDQNYNCEAPVAIEGFVVERSPRSGDSGTSTYSLNNADQIRYWENDQYIYLIGVEIESGVQSVQYEYINAQGISTSEVHNTGPNGDIGYVLPGIEVGSYSITAIPYSEPDLGGIPGRVLTISYEIIEDLEISVLHAVRSSDGASTIFEDITYEPSGVYSADVDHYKSVDGEIFTGIAPILSSNVKSVNFNISGPSGNEDVVINGEFPILNLDEIGAYDVYITPYSEEDLSGVAGFTYYYRFNIVDHCEGVDCEASISNLIIKGGSSFGDGVIMNDGQRINNVEISYFPSVVIEAVASNETVKVDFKISRVDSDYIYERSDATIPFTTEDGFGTSIPVATGHYVVEVTPFLASGEVGEKFTLKYEAYNGCLESIEQIVIETRDATCGNLNGSAYIDGDVGFLNGPPADFIYDSQIHKYKSENLPPGDYSVYIDKFPLCSATINFTIADNPDCPEPNDFELRINTGGLEVDYNGKTFVTDAYFNAGNTLDRPQTGLPEPYKSFRYSPSQLMSYDIPIPNGEYTVNLYFAELWFGATGGGAGGAGSRVFDVKMEGQLIHDNLDIFNEVGAENMLLKSNTITVIDGILHVGFDSRDVAGGERHPVINAIEIVSANSSGGSFDSAKSIVVNPSILSPNPVINSTTLSFENPVQLNEIQVFDITGRLVHTYQGTSVKDQGAYMLDVNELPAGTYFVRSQDTQGQQYQKKMVIKK